MDTLLPKTRHRMAVAIGVVATAWLAAGFFGLSMSKVAASADPNVTAATPAAVDPQAASAALAAAAPGAPVIAPVPGARVNEVFGAKGSHWKVAHSGIDFEVKNGTPIQAVVDGRIASVSLHRAYGKVVRLVRADKVEIWFCHLSKVDVVPGQQVTQGQVLGLSGQTGNVTGPHLHVEVRIKRLPTDPGVFFFATPGVPGPILGWVKPYWEKPIEGYSEFKEVKDELKYVPHAPIH